MKTPTSWPQEIRKGNALVRIYRVENKKRKCKETGENVVEYRVAYYDAKGARRMKAFADYAEAYKEANTVAGSVSRGDIHAITLRSEDAIVFTRANDTLKPLGIPMDVAIADYVTAAHILKGNSLKLAAESYMRSHANITTKLVSAVVGEFIADRRAPGDARRKASARYLKDLESRLGKFAEACKCPLTAIGPEEIRMFLKAVNGGARNKHNFTQAIRTLFRWAQSRRYYPRDVDPLEGIETRFDDDGEIEIFKPKELVALLNAARPELVPYIAIGAFAGLRQSELQRLDWREVGEKYIEVTAGKAKTRSRRLVPVQPNLQQWLAPYRKERGLVCQFASVWNQLPKVAADAKVKWAKNGLRHSFVSYRYAVTQNEHTVSAEAGNSAAMVFKNYRAVVTAEDAKAWFAIAPTTAVNVVPLSSAVGE